MTDTEQEGYKRRVRVVFVARGADAWIAAAYAWALGSAWLDVRCARFTDAEATPAAAPSPADAGDDAAQPHPTTQPPRIEPLTAPLQRWADLAVLMGAPDDAHTQGAWPGATVRHWDPSGGPMADPRRRCDVLRERVEAMLGGLRMLARDTPPRTAQD